MVGASATSCSERDRQPGRVVLAGEATPGSRLHRPRVPATGPRWSRTFGPAPQLPPSSADHAVAATSLPKRKLVPSTHIRCRMMASLRASSTLARFMPRRPATSSAQRFRVENETGPGQHHVGRLVEHAPHHRVAHLADPAGDVGLAGLVLLRREPEVSAHRARSREPARLVDRRGEGDRHQRTDARHRHQPTAGRVLADDAQHGPVQGVVLGAQRFARPSIGRSPAPASPGRSSSRNADGENRPLLTTPTFNPKPRRMPRMLSSTSNSLACKSLRPTSSARISWAGGDLQCTGRNPAHPQELGDAAGVLAVGLDHHRRQRRLHLAVSSSTVSNPAAVAGM